MCSTEPVGACHSLEHVRALCKWTWARRAQSFLLHSIAQIDAASICRAACLTAIYLPGHIFAAMLTLYFAIFPRASAAAALGVALAAYYYATSKGKPAHTSCRRWPLFERWMSREVPSMLQWWLRTCDVRPESPCLCVLSRGHQLVSCPLVVSSISDFQGVSAACRSSKRFQKLSAPSTSTFLGMCRTACSRQGRRTFQCCPRGAPPSLVSSR